MSSLFVLLPAAPGEYSHMLSPDGRTAGPLSSAPAALLPAPGGAGAEIVAVVPVQRLSWHQAELPRGVGLGSPRLAAVLEGLLEDRLLDDAAALHLAVQAGASGAVWVAACDQTWLRTAVTALEAAGRPVDRIVPELAPQPTAALYALADGEGGTLALAGPDGVLQLPLSAAARALLPALPPDLTCLAEPAVAALAEQHLDRKFALQQAPQRWLAAAQNGWDLAQQAFASGARTRTWKRLGSVWAQLLRGPAWRPVRWGLLLLVLANLIGLNAWAWKERASLEAKRQGVQRVLTSTFPQVKVVVDAPLQMEREVAALRQATGASSGRDLETLLGALAQVADGRSVTALEWTGAELRVRGLGWDASQAAAAAPGLKALGVLGLLQGEVLVLSAEAG